jgi:hypothetical protein
MTRQRGGDKRSSWETFRRRLLLAQRYTEEPPVLHEDPTVSTDERTR